MGLMLDSDKKEPWDKDSLVFSSFIIGIIFSSIALYIGLGFAIFTNSNIFSALIVSSVSQLIIFFVIYFGEKTRNWKSV